MSDLESSRLRVTASSPPFRTAPGSNPVFAAPSACTHQVIAVGEQVDGQEQQVDQLLAVITVGGAPDVRDEVLGNHHHASSITARRHLRRAPAARPLVRARMNEVIRTTLLCLPLPAIGQEHKSYGAFRTLDFGQTPIYVTDP